MSSPPPSYCCLPLPLPSAKAAAAKHIQLVLPAALMPALQLTAVLVWPVSVGRLEVVGGRQAMAAQGGGSDSSCSLVFLCRQQGGAGMCAVLPRLHLIRLLLMTIGRKMFFRARAWHFLQVIWKVLASSCILGTGLRLWI